MSIDVNLMADRFDGNDPLEAIIRLPEVPRKGTQIEVWNARGGSLSGSRETGLYYSGHPLWLIVDDEPTFEFWEGETQRIVVTVRMETYDQRELERAFEALEAGEEPGMRIPYDPHDAPLYEEDIKVLLAALADRLVTDEDLALARGKLQRELDRRQR